jgi:NAD+ diphosphatase
MKPETNPNWFANSPLTRLNGEKSLDAYVAEKIKDPGSLLLPLWRGDPLVTKSGVAGFLSASARGEFPASCPVVLLGVAGGRTYFAIDVSGAASAAEAAPFADLGTYMPLRAAAAALSRDDTAIFGHARWLFEWRRKHRFCANCGAENEFSPSGAKAKCRSCDAEHFPRTDPVVIVLAVHEGDCLLGRSPRFPPGFLSALAGFVEAGETPEEAARREIFEEAGVRLLDIRYQFSQPWPFPSSLMMGFIADAAGRDLALDMDEIAEARWIARADVRAVLAGAERDFLPPPPFTIARQLLERWAGEPG